MARMETGGQHFEEVRIDARLDGDRAERVQQHLDGTDKSGAELVREALDEYLGEDEPDGPYIRPPENEDLRRALSTLQQLARGNGGTVLRDVALTELAQKFSRSTGACNSTLLQPLSNAGYLQNRGGFRSRGTIRVVLPSDIPDIIENAGTLVERDTGGGEDGTPDYDDPKTAAERLEALSEAGEGVAETAD